MEWGLFRQDPRRCLPNQILIPLKETEAEKINMSGGEFVIWHFKYEVHRLFLKKSVFCLVRTPGFSFTFAFCWFLCIQLVYRSYK